MESSDSKPEPNPPMTLLEAVKIIQNSGGLHFNFGKNVEARDRFYTRRAEAKELVELHGFTLRPVKWGYRIVEFDDFDPTVNPPPSK